MNDRERHAAPAPAPAKTGATPATREVGWLPDCVYTGEKFESGLAFFADDFGRLTRFSREPADLAAARRLAGQAALPGLVNAHSCAIQRVLRGRAESRARAGGDASTPGRTALNSVIGRLTESDVYDAARMAFMEMVLSGITCVGEFHALHHRPDGTPWPDPNFLGHEILRAARDAGLRIALLKVACARSGFRQPPEAGQIRSLTPTVDQFLREVEMLVEFVARNHPGDEAWVGVAPQSLATVPLDFLKAMAAFAHVERLRLHVPVSARPADNEACLAEYGRTPVALLAEHGLIDKRFVAVHAIHITDAEARVLGAARAMVCACPTSERHRGDGAMPADKLLAAGAALALGTDSQVQIDLFEDARLLEYHLRMQRLQQNVLAPDLASTLFQAATVGGARSLGAPSGSLEVGRPADFFTIHLFDPSIAGAEPNALLANIVFALQRRAIREVWVRGQQRVANGRHVFQGAIISRFVDLQRRLWGAA